MNCHAVARSSIQSQSSHEWPRRAASPIAGADQVARRIGRLRFAPRFSFDYATAAATSVRQTMRWGKASNMAEHHGRALHAEHPRQSRERRAIPSKGKILRSLPLCYGAAEWVPVDRHYQLAQIVLVGPS